MRKSACALALLLGLTAKPAHASPPRWGEPGSITKTTLTNGLTVLLHEDHRVPMVSVNVWYHVGSKNEAPGKSGFAHLFEHLMFQGSKHVPEDTFFRFLERAGGSGMNGTTNQDRTNYFETVPRNRLELALWLESDRMAFLLDHVDDKTFANQRDVVKNERRQNYENAPYGMVLHHEHEALYPVGHPYRHLTIGTPQDLDQASLKDVHTFFRTHYTPTNATLALAGDFDPKDALSLVEKYFGPIVGGPAPERRAKSPVSLTKTVRLEMDAGVELSRVVMAWPSPAFFAPGDAALDLLARTLSAGKTSRLYKRLVYDDKVAQSVSAHQSSGELCSTFELEVTGQPKVDAETLLRKTDAILSELLRDGVTEREVTLAKSAFGSHELFGVEGLSARADRMNLYHHYLGTPDYFTQDLERYRSLKAQDISQVAQSTLSLEKRIVTLVHPTPQAPISGRLRGTP